jgi:hypothetical protein
MKHSLCSREKGRKQQKCVHTLERATIVLTSVVQMKKSMGCGDPSFRVEGRGGGGTMAEHIAAEKEGNTASSSSSSVLGRLSFLFVSFHFLSPGIMGHRHHDQHRHQESTQS